MQIDLLKLINDPAARRRLSAPQLAEVLKQVNSILAAKGVANVPDNPADFASLYSNGKWVHAPHLDLLSSWIKEAEAGKRKRLLISMPPRHGKSELISYWTPLWLLARNPKRRIMLASYEADFAAKWGRRIRDSIISFGDKLALSLNPTSTAANRWELTAGGGMETAGVGGPMTGKGADVLIIDDPIKNDEEARSEVYRENMWEWFQGTAFTRLEPKGFMIVVATRWHEDDLLGRLERQKEEGGLEWDVLKLKAVAEEEDQLGRKQGEALWPARYDLKALEEIKSGQSPYFWGALYQQNPTPAEGNAVKRDWWKYYKDVPKDFDQMIQSWDTSFKDLDTSDYAVGQVWGRKGAQFFLLHQIRERMNGADLIQAIRFLTKMYPQATAKLIEDSANGPAVTSILEREVPGMIPVRARGNKFSRLQGAIPLIQAGNVFVPENIDGTVPRWVQDLIHECAAFPNSTYDDQVDATSQALNYLKPAGWRSVDQNQREALKMNAKNPADPAQARFHRFYTKAIKRSFREIRSQNRLGDGKPRKIW